MADKLVYNPKDDTQNYSSCRLQLVIERFEHSTQLINQSKFNISPKLLSQRTRKRCYKTMGTGVINSPIPPPSLFGTREI